MIKKRFLTWIIAALLTAGIITALWIIGPSITGMAVYKISSNKPNITIQSNFAGVELDTTNSSLSYTDRFVVNSRSQHGAMVLISKTINKQNLSDECLDYLDDCNISYFLGDSESEYGYGYNQPTGLYIDDNSTIEMSPGLNYFLAYLNCKQYSCPQDIQGAMTLQLLEV